MRMKKIKECQSLSRRIPDLKLHWQELYPEGKDPYAIERLQQDIANLGYKKLILKRDNEVAIVALTEAVR